MENLNKGNRQQGNQNSEQGSNQWNDPNQIVNQQDQNRAINTGDEEFKENVTGRTPEQPPRDLNISGADKNTSEGSEGGAEIETPRKPEGDDETSTERKLPRM